MNSIHVPRVTEITGKKPVEQTRDERRWQAERNGFKDIGAKAAFGSKESRDEWLRRIRRTRSF